MKFDSLDDHAFDVLFRKARTHNTRGVWKDAEVPDAQLRQLYDLLKFGPTSANCSPARFLFVKSKEGKERLKPHLDAGNVEKTMTAPVTAIIAHDMKFYEHMAKLYPHDLTARVWFEGKEAKIKDTAFRNGTLQGAYMMLAARAVGLDCGPMSGFNPKGVKEAFFKDHDVEINFLCNLGHGDVTKLHPRGPRFEFDEVCKIV
jgi:3-hydroxypropanoate dehydrogenase